MNYPLKLIATLLLAPIIAMAQDPIIKLNEIPSDSIAVEHVVIDNELAVDSVIVDIQQPSLPDDDMMAAAAIIMDSYSKPWTQLSMQGKLLFDGLPVKPTVKIYMKRNESIILSARASILGEVARLEINRDSISIINKHTKKYTSINLQRYSGQYPDIISDFQDLMLGEIAYPGYGRLTPDLANQSHWSLEDGMIFLSPNDNMLLSGIDYGFLIDPTEQKLHDFIMFFESKNMILDFNYLFGLEGWTLGLVAEINGKTIDGALQLSYPDYFPTAMEFTDAGSRYSRSDLKGVLKF